MNDSRSSGSPATDQPVDTVLLDVDGTLIDSTYFHALAWIRAFAEHDLTPDWWRVHRTVGMGGDLLVGEVCGDDVEQRLGDDLRTAWADRYRKLLPEVKAFSGTREFIGSLQRAGLRVALASSGAAEFTDAALDILGMTRDQFVAVTSSEDADNSKPEPDILAVALDKAGGGAAVVVGDTVWDVESATRLGARCVAVRSGGFSEAELREAGAVRVVDDVGVLAREGWKP
ncbi:HAD family hydrolase [Gordonia sp. LSe1-13]|uniref:HAD family hydrolase n=1 Tax=Gordonia sesuvii TaxID=3116777 RepID=A0ABU7MAY3_9ACTN|nr:HAD family hydrolase [Gordonia sp. LSe1-13]